MNSCISDVRLSRRGSSSGVDRDISLLYIFFLGHFSACLATKKKKDTNIYMKVVRDPDITCPELIRTSEMTFRFSVFQIVHEFPVLVGFQGCFLCGSGDC